LKQKEQKGDNLNPLEFAANQIGSELSRNLQQASNEAHAGMDIFRKIAIEKYNVDIEFKKGNFFEYIEACKFNVDAVEKEKGIRAVVTHAIGKPHDPADILLKDGNRTVEVQAKVHERISEYAFDMRNDKYHNMQRLVPKDKTEEVNNLLQKRIGNGNINEDKYQNAKENLTGKLSDKHMDVASKGTSTQELYEAGKNPSLYATKFEIQQYAKEVGVTAANQAASSAIITGVILSVKATFDVLQDKKKFNQAIREVTRETTKAGAKGGVIGFLSSLIRIGANAKNVTLISEASAATALAGGMLDLGIVVYDYTKGEIDNTQLKNQILDTGVKVVSTVYISKAVALTLGVSNVFIPMAAYTISYYVILACRSIYQDAKLKEEEYNRVASLYEEATKALKEQRIQLENYIHEYVHTNRTRLMGFISDLENAMITQGQFDKVIYNMNSFATSYGQELRYTDFNDFKSMMKNKGEITL
jgi:hypothetical protein